SEKILCAAIWPGKAARTSISQETLLNLFEVSPPLLLQFGNDVDQIIFLRLGERAQLLVGWRAILVGGRQPRAPALRDHRLHDPRPRLQTDRISRGHRNLAPGEARRGQACSPQSSLGNLEQNTRFRRFLP